jgi:dimethylhistidine N-methyltransferase
MNVHRRVVTRERDPAQSAFADDVIAGLCGVPKRLPPKYFYDAAGSLLFEEITALPEYYPTRCELEILRSHAADMARLMPPNTTLIEFGSGSSRKARILIAHAPAISAYVPVDISPQMLEIEAAGFRRDYPHVSVMPVAADFTGPFRIPAQLSSRPRTGFFPGSTIGNFEPDQASAFLAHARRILGDGAILFVGIDLVKDTRILDAAYNDAAGVTARFNLNLLSRLNRELAADFDLDSFSHDAFYDPGRRRVEMHLASRRRQHVRVLDRIFEFRVGETIHTENSYKYTDATFAALACGAGWVPRAAWTDRLGYFSVQALQANSQ